MSQAQGNNSEMSDDDGFPATAATSSLVFLARGPHAASSVGRPSFDDIPGTPPGSWPRSWKAASNMYCHLDKWDSGSAPVVHTLRMPDAEVGAAAPADDDLTAPLLPSSPRTYSGSMASVHSARIPAVNGSIDPAGSGCTEGSAVAEFLLTEDLGTATLLQTILNAVNILCGVGLLATPYAVATGGWASLSILVLTGAITCYTGLLLVRCMQARPGTQTYPDIGWQAFGATGRLVVATLLYLELFCCCVDFLILQGDTLAAIFPAAAVQLGPLVLNAKQAMMAAAALVILPSVWLRDLSLMSFLSLGGSSASAALLVLVGLQAVLFPLPASAQPVPLLGLSRLPISIGLYSFCFAGHAVFPSLYTSMQDKRRFGVVLAVAFTAAVLLYGGMAVIGAGVFGASVSENVTLSMRSERPGSVPAQLSMWLVVVSPATKFAMTMAPIAMAVEELGPITHATKAFGALSMAVRTGMLLLILVVAVAVPFFALVMSFIGAFLSMSISVVVPCIFHLAICGARMPRWQVALDAAVIVAGVATGGVATYESVRKIVGGS